jgi:hypothetical protein
VGILNWDKPKKVKTTQEWKNDGGFDGGPNGGYQSNMSKDDMESWKAKLTGTKLGYPQVEIRKTAMGGTQITIIVNLGAGYNYKQYRAEDPKYLGKKVEDFPNKYHGQFPDDPEHNRKYSWTAEQIEEWSYPTRGVNVHLSMNGPAQMTFEDMSQMQQAVQEAKEYLEKNEKSLISKQTV